MRALQILFSMAAVVGLLSACAYHKTELEDGHDHEHTIHIDADD